MSTNVRIVHVSHRGANNQRTPDAGLPFPMLEKEPLHFIYTTAAIGTEQCAFFQPCLAAMEQQPDTGRIARLCISRDILRLESEAGADGGIGMFRVDRLLQEIDLDHLLKAIEVNHIAIRVAAEAGGAGKRHSNIRFELGKNGCRRHSLPDAAAARAVQIIRFIGFFDEGLVHGASSACAGTNRLPMRVAMAAGSSSIVPTNAATSIKHISRPNCATGWNEVLKNTSMLKAVMAVV